MSDKKGIPGQLYVFSTAQRVVHWLVVGGFALLAFTGAPIYLDSPLVQGGGGIGLRLWHRIGCAMIAVAVLIYILCDFKGLVKDVTKIFTWGSDDVGWFKAAPAYYFVGDEGAMPAQDKYNTGQKLWYVTVVIGGLGIGATGLIMWFGRGIVSAGLFRWSVFLHSVLAIALVAFTLVHIYLAVMHPLMKDGLDAIRFGYMGEEYLKHHHAKYYEELTSE